ncbi:TonB-dependent receptor [Sphingomonadaceae bacterium OTU29THOMA1]|nr:TonB-dependent receptor [Sphingomonadaceae bacterium OTU29THOMA1]
MTTTNGARMMARTTASALALAMAINATPAMAQSTPNTQTEPAPGQLPAAPSPVLPPAAAPVTNPSPAEAPRTDQSAVAPADPQEGEDIVVTGIRNSLQGALSAKRDAAQVLDAISAEDIGQFPDKNIGEALQRVTGVQLTRTNGEGSGVTIRGADPNLNRVEVNGITQLSTTAGQRDVDFRDLPVEFVNRLEVVKSVTPDMTEGGLGGTVRIITRRPFDNKENSFLAGSVQGIYTELTGKVDPKLALIGSKKFADDTFGILLSGTYERRRVESHEARTTGWRQIDGNAALAGLQPLDLDGNGNGDFFPDIPRYVINRLDTKRFALNGVAEWRPEDGIRAYVQGNFARGKQDVNSQYLQVTTSGSILDRANTTIGEDDTVSHVEFVDNPAAARANRLQVAYRNILGDITRTTWNGAIGGDYDRDGWKINSLLSYTRAKIDNNYINATADAIGLSRVVVDYANDQNAPRITLPIDVTTTAGINSVTAQYRPVINVQDEWSSKVDVEYTRAAPWLSSLKAGMQVRKLTADSAEYNATTTIDAFTNPALLGQVQSVASQMTIGSTPFFDTGDLGYSGGISGWRQPNYAFVDTIGLPDPFGTPTLLNTWQVAERNIAGYVQGSFEFDPGVPIRGTVGARVVNTRTVSDGFRTQTGATLPVQFESDQTEFLPSLNIRADIVPNKLLFRGSATEVIARPTPQQLAPRFSIDVVGLTGSRGNPDLQPFRARQYDAGFEYYINRTSYLSATYFRKEIGSFIENRTQSEVVDGVTYAITLPVNGTQKVTINGAEVGAQVAFDFLSTPVLRNMGVIANYTYSKDSGYEGRDFFTGGSLPFPGLSRHSYNVSLYHENKLFSVRGSYNWRSDYLITAIGRGNNPEFGEAFGQFDASASINLTEKVSMFLEGVNLTDATRKENANSVYRRTLLETYGRRVYGGVRFRF